MAGIHDSGEDSISGINVTPLVDVVLVLLVIFMMTAPVIYQSAIKVDLPKAQSGESSGNKNPIQVSIDHEGKIYWNQELVTTEQLKTHLSEIKNPAEQMATLNADKLATHGQVVDVMDILRSAGVVKFSLTVQQSTHQ
jgi:biopolymer transport protein ExbD